MKFNEVKSGFLTIWWNPRLSTAKICRLFFFHSLAFVLPNERELAYNIFFWFPSLHDTHFASEN